MEPLFFYDSQHLADVRRSASDLRCPTERRSGDVGSRTGSTRPHKSCAMCMMQRCAADCRTDAAWIHAIGLATFVLSHASIAAPIARGSDLPTEAQCKIYTALAALRRRCDAIAHVLSACCRRCHRRCHHARMPPTAYIALNTMGLAAILMIGIGNAMLILFPAV
jgi:hypothetical protein